MSAAVITVLIAMLGGAIRVSTPFMFVALGECLTEKSGRVNLGLEGTLVLGAMVGYATSYHAGSPWARGPGGRRGGLVARRDARNDLRPAARERRRGRHRDDAVRRRSRLLLRQALHPAGGAAARLDPARLLEPQREPEERAAGQSAVLRRHRDRARARLVAAQHPLGPRSCAPSATAPPQRARWASRSIACGS